MRSGIESAAASYESLNEKLKQMEFSYLEIVQALMLSTWWNSKIRSTIQNADKNCRLRVGITSDKGTTKEEREKIINSHSCPRFIAHDRKLDGNLTKMDMIFQTNNLLLGLFVEEAFAFTVHQHRLQH